MISSIHREGNADSGGPAEFETHLDRPARAGSGRPAGYNRPMGWDVAVVGGGVVGRAFAAALRGSGLAVALIDGQAPPPGSAGESAPRREAAPSSPLPRPGEEEGPARPSGDPRVYALSPGSRAFLAALGAWDRLDPERVARVERMEVYGDDARSRIVFSAYELGRAALAYLVEHRALQAALGAVLAAEPPVAWRHAEPPAALAWGPQGITLCLDGGETLEARLVVGADGADSWVRRQAGIEARAKSYGQQAVVAHFRCERPHHHTAFQWFREDGVLALLPLPGEHVSLVWSTGDTQAAALLALDDSSLAARVEEASRGAVGALDVISPPAAFPLRLVKVERLAAPRVALVGDAAHVIHPLAGQGVNLGLQDAQVLAHVLRKRGPVTDCGDYFLLRRYERARWEEVALMQLATDALQRLFGARAWGVGWLRNTGLRLVDALTPVKARLAQQALGDAVE
jgi:2-octaprenylphenol hydroxylase